MNDSQGPKIEYGPITVHKINDTELNGKIIYSATLVQEVTKVYGANASDEFTKNVYSTTDIGVETERFSSKRYAVIKIPAEATQEEVQKKIDAHPNAKIRRFISNKLILTEGDKSVIEQGLREEGYYVEKQLMDNKKTGELILHKGKPQFGRNTFSKDGGDDIDYRTTDGEYYSNEDIELRLSDGAPEDVKVDATQEV